jgi:hypothetical protein
MTDDVTSPSDLKELSEKELWKIAADDDHPGQLAAQMLLKEDEAEDVDSDQETSTTEETSADDKALQAASDDSKNASDKTFEELCESIANDEEIDERLRRVCEGLLEDIRSGELDGGRR